MIETPEDLLQTAADLIASGSPRDACEYAALFRTLRKYKVPPVIFNRRPLFLCREDMRRVEGKTYSWQ